jgi:hypothetical protein
MYNKWTQLLACADDIDIVGRTTRDSNEWILFKNGGSC